jgi:cilia- and flagella-associated protein 52
MFAAWNDGNIRAFTPLTGRLIYCIFNTHNKGTSALDMTQDGRTLISGGCEGQVSTSQLLPTTLISKSLRNIYNQKEC